MLLNKIRVLNWVTNSDAPRGREESTNEQWVGGCRVGGGLWQSGIRVSYGRGGLSYLEEWHLVH